MWENLANPIGEFDSGSGKWTKSCKFTDSLMQRFLTPLLASIYSATAELSRKQCFLPQTSSPFRRNSLINLVPKAKPQKSLPSKLTGFFLASFRSRGPALIMIHRNNPQAEIRRAL